MVYTRFFSLQNSVCFIILTYLVPVLFTFHIQGVLKLNNSGAKRLSYRRNMPTLTNTGSVKIMNHSLIFVNGILETMSGQGNGTLCIKSAFCMEFWATRFAPHCPWRD